MRKRLRTMLVRRVLVHIDVYSEEVSLCAGRDHALGRRSSITAAVAHQSQQVQLHQTPLVCSGGAPITASTTAPNSPCLQRWRTNHSKYNCTKLPWGVCSGGAPITASTTAPNSPGEFANSPGEFGAPHRPFRLPSCLETASRLRLQVILTSGPVVALDSPTCEN